MSRKNLLKIEMELKPKKGEFKLTPQSGSVFHGLLLEQFPRDYAVKVHNMDLKPFSQYVLWDNAKGVAVWKVQGFEEEACLNLQHLLDRCTDIKIKHRDREFEVVSFKKEYSSYAEIAGSFFASGTAPSKINVVFRTPASFKSRNQYQLFPTVRHIYQSLLMKWNMFSGELKVEEEGFLEQLESSTSIVSYKLKSLYYPVESVRIPAFHGSVSLRLQGPEALRGLASSILHFAEYAGIGVKTAMGMGGVSVE